MLRNGYILALAALFLGVVFFLKQIELWDIIGLSEPAGYLWQGFLFLGLLLWLQNAVFNPYLRTVEIREEETTRKAQRAHAMRGETATLASQYQTQIDEARARSIREREQIALQAEQEEKRRLAQVKKESQASLNDALSVLQQERNAASEELRKPQDALVQEILDQILGTPNHQIGNHPTKRVDVEAKKGL